MGREVRMVPKSREHPKREDGQFAPLLSADVRAKQARWDVDEANWNRGLRESYDEPGKLIPHGEAFAFEDWDGPRPRAEEYMPQWPESECTHLMMYETCSEGTPISPAFATPEELARWLSENDASAFAGLTATYDQWLMTIKRGWSISASIKDGVLRSGVADT